MGACQRTSRVVNADRNSDDTDILADKTTSQTS